METVRDLHPLRHIRSGGWLHHAYLLEGERDATVTALWEALKAGHGVVRSGNPDVSYAEYTNLLLGDAHELRVRGSFSGWSGGKKVHVIAFETMTHEAQNALLKTIEEPTPNTHFFFVTGSAEVLLPTVRSRMVHIKIRADDEREHRTTAGEEFLAAPIGERLRIVMPLHADKKKKEDGSNKIEARELLDGIERALYAKGDIAKPERARALADVLTAKKYLLGRSPILKPLLEHLALTLPRFQ